MRIPEASSCSTVEKTTCNRSFVHEGGLVPKSLYVSGAFTEPLCVGAADEGSVLEQKGWREGDHFHRVEPTLGSHVMITSGSYVLQWRCEAMDTHRAAQLMYFHETLASHQYK
ncbi:SEC14-like protein 1 [Operophtera brumata]|uniref:SEC14-like protein 1 n=1 Tax=Operophtera brumata TaxID=104452 RepID=A0A0L7L587_OPEBR|nr:SEC14-like protein 1 [Operophtera brumata]